jgi:hypothetical protein
MTCTLPSFLNSPDPVIWSGNVVVTLVQPRKNRDTTRKTGISPFCKKTGVHLQCRVCSGLARRRAGSHLS